MTSLTQISFFDSGVGGLSYMETLKRRYPHLGLSYFADVAHFPYGEKSPASVRDRVVSVVGSLLERERAELVVIACNTASVIALETLRENFHHIPFVGVVPAVKPAALTTQSGRILVMSTARTAEDTYTRSLQNEFASTSTVDRIGFPELVEVVEETFCSPSGDNRIREVIRRTVLPRIKDDTDVLVLACTHFLHIRNILDEEIPKHVRIVDSLDGVVRRIEHLSGLDGRTVGPAAKKEIPVRFYFSGGTTLPRQYSCLTDRYDVRGVPW